jgi:2-octaprenylphenol hydroxylase
MPRPERRVVIIGAGPVGLCLAALLAGIEGLRVRVLEAGAAPSVAGAEADLRVYALSRASERRLRAVGAWDAIAVHATPYREMSVWASNSSAGVHFDAADIGEPDLGHIVADSVLRRALIAELRKLSSVTLDFGRALAAIEVEAREVHAKTVHGEVYSGELLIAADGAASSARALLGMPVLRRDYEQTAVVAQVESERGHRATAWQRFLPQGPLALLPLQNNASAVVWSTSPPEADRLLRVEAADFAAELTAASDGVLGSITQVAGRASFPLQILHAPRYCRARVALVGDAAHTVHPLAGQGLNLGLADAAALARSLGRACREGQDPGDLKGLRAYELERKGDNLAMLAVLDGIHRLFRFSGALGGLSLAAANAVTPVRRALMRQALGLPGFHGGLETDRDAAAPDRNIA